jgi:uncharacterized repeat protein (TIGR03803 family)
MNGETQMRRKQFGNGFHRSLATSAVIFMLATAAWAVSNEKILYTLTSEEGINPAASLIFDANGALYGTTTAGGQSSCGAVFQVSPTGNGAWSESTLHSFACGPADGKAPQSALLFDLAGNLYGTTSNGGSDDCGIVFELTPLSGGGWTESVLYDFGSGDKGHVHGCHPYSNLVFDAAGKLYGTTNSGGGGITEGSCDHGCGVVFQLSAQGGGWTESVLHSFRGRNNDGENPFAGLVMDSAGSLYGTTFSGGSVFGGTIFRLTPNQGSWKESVLYNFRGGRDGANPYAGLVFDHAGALYGTTVNGGISSVGTVFQLAPASGGKWKESVLHSFAPGGTDGFYPFDGVILDAAGNAYGTTQFGGALKRGLKGTGTVFKLAPNSGGEWKEEIVFDFSARERADQMQRNPFGGLVSDANGNFFGTAQSLEGILLGGVVFELTP